MIRSRLENMCQKLYKKSMKIFKPVLKTDGSVLIQCNGGYHYMKPKEWDVLANSFDDIQDFSPFGPDWNQHVKKLKACFDISGINTDQFDAQEPLPDDQAKAVDAFATAAGKSFQESGLDGVTFQIVAPGRKPKYDVNHALAQGAGWQSQAGYTLVVMLPGADKTKFFGADAEKALDDYGIGDGVKAVLDEMNKGQAEKLGLALVLDNGFPA